MAKEPNFLILDSKEHAIELSKLLKKYNAPFKLVHPKEDLAAFKFIFEEPLSPMITKDMNNMFDKWFQQVNFDR